MFEAIGNWYGQFMTQTVQWWASHPVFTGVWITVWGVALLVGAMYSVWYWHECSKKGKLLREELKKMWF